MADITELNDLRLQDWNKVFDVFQDGIYITNAKGLTLQVNAAYEKITGVPAKKVLGRYMTEIVEEGVLSNSITQQVIETGESVRAQQVVAETGKHLILQGWPVRENGKIIMVVTIVRDTTAINRLQEELAQSRQMAMLYKTQLTNLRNSESYVAESQAFRAAIDLAHKVAKVDSTVLILGESGTGKEVIAREIHETSGRKGQVFLKTNCGAIPENLLESELFGYEGGSFTGAKRGGHVGLFEEASKGTLFLDEIGDMPLHLQVKLLRVLQERTITRIGSTKAIPIQTRIIAATNQDLATMVKEKKFREDLYYRLNIVVIKSPPLRERKEEIPSLINHFTNKINAKYNLSKQLSPELVSALMEYDWPGNVRELENIIERILVTSNEDVISLTGVRLPWAVTQGNTIPEEIFPEYEDVPLAVALDRLEKQILQDAAKHYKSTYQIAKKLKLSQPTVSRKLQKYGIELPK